MRLRCLNHGKIVVANDGQEVGHSYGDGYNKGYLIGLLTVRAYFTNEDVL